MSKNIDCDIIKDLLPLYNEDMVSEDSRQIIEEHLLECEECKTIHEQMTQEINFSLGKKPMKKRKIKRKNRVILLILSYVLLLILINVALIINIAFF